MTIRENSITFNNSCISKLEDATYIQFLINPKSGNLLSAPVKRGPGTLSAGAWSGGINERAGRSLAGRSLLSSMS